MVMSKASQQYIYRIDTKSIRTPAAVITELEKLNSLLVGSELLPVSFFNRAYIIVTRKIDEANNSGLFQHPRLMNALEVTFAKEYFNALNSYVETGILPGKWSRLHAAQVSHKPASFSLLRGAHAHINDDLLPSLKKVIESPPKFKKDYFQVNTLLLGSAKAISASYYEADPRINYLKKYLRALYLKPIMLVILRWRTRVWYKLERDK